MFLVTMRRAPPYLDLDVAVLVFVVGRALVDGHEQQSHGQQDGDDVELDTIG